MLISETLVGGLIGIGGFNISRIRNESGATIKVSKPCRFSFIMKGLEIMFLKLISLHYSLQVCGGRGEQNYRQLQFGGSAEQA